MNPLPPGGGENTGTGLAVTSHVKQPHSRYHLEQPHRAREKNGHLGTCAQSGVCAYTSMDLLNSVVKDAFKEKMIAIWTKFYDLNQIAAKNAQMNLKRESVLVDANRMNEMVKRNFLNMLENAKAEFLSNREPVLDILPLHGQEIEIAPLTAIPLPIPVPEPSNIMNQHSSLLGKRSTNSPENILLNKRLKVVDPSHQSTGPTAKKRTPTNARTYNSPYRTLKAEVVRKIETWDPSSLTTESSFVMGTRANKALGLGATRGRIYMKHPELFKYSGDHEDKKWMVKNGCMAATGGKNTFVMIAQSIHALYLAEYKDCPGTMPSELKYFKMPEFILCKMRSAMQNDKELRVNGLPPTGRPPEGCPSMKNIMAHPRDKSSKRAAAAAAAAAAANKS